MKTKLTLLTVLLVLSTHISAVIVNGTCGDNLTWELNTQDSTLTISGFGEMANYSYSNVPWSPYRKYIAFVSLPNELTSIGNYAFSGCSSLTDVTIPNSVTSIGYDAFCYCSKLISITIPNSVTSIGDWAFECCNSLTSVTIPNSVTSIGDWAFINCSSLTSVTIGNGVTSIGSYAFENCSNLTSVTIPNSVTSIGNGAFRDCSSLTSITIPNSVTSIGNSAFSYCSGLKTIYNYAEMPQNISSDVFDGVGKSTCTLYVPANSIELYQRAEGWRSFSDIKPISD